MAPTLYLTGWHLLSKGQFLELVLTRDLRVNCYYHKYTSSISMANPLSCGLRRLVIPTRKYVIESKMTPYQVTQRAHWPSHHVPPVASDPTTWNGRIYHERSQQFEPPRPPKYKHAKYPGRGWSDSLHMEASEGKESPRAYYIGVPWLVAKEDADE